MRWDQVKQNWASVSKSVKRKWGKFTDEDLEMISGQRESFVRLFAMRYGSDQEAAGAKIDAFVMELESRPKRKHLISWTQRCWTNLGSYIPVPARR
jgi:uncharacterized protein YjbJ (UPF0337 family)